MKLTKVAIHGVPRSGTTWLGSIFDSSEHVLFRNQPLFSYQFKSYLTENSNRLEIETFFEDIANSKDPYLNQEELKLKGLIPTFPKLNPTHIVYKEARYHHILSNLLNTSNDIKVIGIIRDPKSVISSWYCAPKEFDKNWLLIEEWKNASKKNKGALEEYYGYNKWKEVCYMFLDLSEKFPDQFYLLEYRQLLKNTEYVIKNLFEFCGIQYLYNTEKFIEKSKTIDFSKEPYSVFRSNPTEDKWKEILPKHIVDEIDLDLIGTRLEIYI